MRTRKRLFPLVTLALFSMSLPVRAESLPPADGFGFTSLMNLSIGEARPLVEPENWAPMTEFDLGQDEGTPTSVDVDQVPEPAVLGLLGIGISGFIMLRRFRKLFQ